MGQKVHPTGFRLSSIEPWRSRWYAKKKQYSQTLIQDHEIRKYINKEYKAAGIPRIEIERTGEAVNVIVHTARPGVLVGRKGVRVDQLKLELQRITGMTCHLTVREIKRPELEAKLVFVNAVHYIARFDGGNLAGWSNHIRHPATLQVR